MKDTGLTTHEAQKRQALYGKNILPHKKPIGDLLIVFNQLKSPLIYVLFFAVVVSFFLTDYKDALVILGAIVLNTFLGYYQERKAQKALYALKQMLMPEVRAIRDKKITKIIAQELVPDDVVLLSVGDRVPADGIVLEENNLLISEAVLTGESVPVTKEAVTAGIQASRESTVYMGTTIIAGRAVVKIIKTGLKTEFGQIASELSQTQEEPTPLQERMAYFAKILAVIFAGLSGMIFLVGLIAGRSFVEMFTTSVAVAVAAIPEGMAVSLTTILAIGMQRILKRKALVRRLVAAEALGSTTIIATDKTGTLTQGNMSVIKTEFTNKAEALLACVFANNREDPLEIAIWEYAQKNNLDPEKLQDTTKRIDELGFDAVRKYMAVIVDKGNKKSLYVKGAPEILLANSLLSKEEKEKWLTLSKKWGSEGLKLIGIGVKQLSNNSRKLEEEVNKITWLGLIGITDPVRETVAEAIKEVMAAGVKLKVITGDYVETSKAILRKIGINVIGEEILEGDEIDQLSQEILLQKIEKTVLFARVTPIQKLRIVNAYKDKGEIVALVGDGVNDAPAIKAANIGIVVSEATDVARLTADIVLLDSNFQTIVAAIEEGRGIYKNIKKVIFYLMAGAFCEMILVTGAILLGLPLPVTASQILWINIITDSLPNLALTIDPKGKNLLKEPPIDPRSNLLDNLLRFLIIIISLVSGGILLITFIKIYQSTGNLQLARTIVFAGLGTTSLLYVFSLRSIKKPVWKSHPFENKWLLGAIVLGFLIQLIPIYHPYFGRFLDTVPISLYDWIIVFTIPVLVIFIIEVIKFVIKVTNHKAAF